MEPQYTPDFNNLMNPGQVTEAPDSSDFCQEILINGKKHHSCTFPNCGKLFRFKSEFNRHVVVHVIDRPFDCPFANCRKTFKREDALKNHVRIHTGELPFKCEVEGCTLSFPTKAGLRYHLLKHKGDKPCVCTHPGCNKSFITMAQLKQHESAVNYHRKVTHALDAPQIVEAPEITEPSQISGGSTGAESPEILDLPNPPLVALPSQFNIPFEMPFAEKKIKKEDYYFDDFFAPDLKPAGNIEWEMKDQFEETNEVSDTMQEDFEKMVRSIFTENNALKSKMDMCSTLMSLMQENSELKQKLNKVSNLEKPAFPENSESNVFSFLNFE